MASTKVQRIMTQPINLIFRFLQSKARIQIWLFEQKDMRIEGRIIVSTRALAVSGFILFLLGFDPVLRWKRLPGNGSREDFTMWEDERGSVLFCQQSWNSLALPQVPNA
ncbi:hypothetical protein QYE76_019926 [Lolium multiflorum]|uniref:Uncharacterized protein n=1 Tax=Lolium multiflorum TaxID=4521 RepID=A0AAD8R6N7_LOLMU|nr:hypothetical protein QYE76_019926 [Lolium multiflorum]